jgi:hypothetical protein
LQLPWRGDNNIFGLKKNVLRVICSPHYFQFCHAAYGPAPEPFQYGSRHCPVNQGYKAQALVSFKKYMPLYFLNETSACGIRIRVCFETKVPFFCLTVYKTCPTNKEYIFFYINVHQECNEHPFKLL